MKWQDSIIKPGQVNFKLKLTQQGEDWDLIIPIQQLLEHQAKRSFAAGATEAIIAIGIAYKDGKQLDSDFIRDLYQGWGIGDVWQEAQEGV